MVKIVAKHKHDIDLSRNVPRVAGSKLKIGDKVLMFR